MGFISAVISGEVLCCDWLTAGEGFQGLRGAVCEGRPEPDRGGDASEGGLRCRQSSLGGGRDCQQPRLPTGLLCQLHCHYQGLCVQLHLCYLRQGQPKPSSLGSTASVLGWVSALMLSVCMTVHCKAFYFYKHPASLLRYLDRREHLVHHHLMTKWTQ